jgi:O-antigen/teichoic acid export membrane protein
MIPGSPLDTEVGLRGPMMRGAAWSVAMRWTVRAIGLISTVILARLLTPEDYGIVAMAMLVVGLIEVFGDTGNQLALLRYREPTRVHYDSAFTIGLLTSLVLGVIVLAVAPLAAWSFGEPRVAPVMQVLSLRVFVGGFSNIGTVAFRHELDFAKDFRFLVYRKLLTFLSGLIAALIVSNYWALVAGIVIGEFGSVASSYAMHHYRPWPAFGKIRELWSMSGWFLLGSVASFAHERGDEYVVSAIAPTDVFGKYHVAADIANLPAAEIVLPLARGLFPIYSRLAAQPEQLLYAYLNVLSMIAVICCAIAAGTAAIADDLVAVLLGSQWQGSAPLLMWLVLHSACVGFASSALLVHQAAGEAQLYARYSWIRVAVMLPALVLVAWLTRDVVDVAIARAAVSLLLIPLILATLPHLIPITAGHVFGVSWRPLIAAGVMYMVVERLQAALPFALPVTRVCVTVPAGAAIFFGVLMVAWLLAGRPPGPERASMRWLGGQLARWRLTAQ